LRRAFIKLLLNYAWWINRKDADGANIFEGGFLGLDNISVFDRSQPLPLGYQLKQADATGWMAMFALNMTAIALELTQTVPDYEDIAIQAYEQFLGICDALSGYATGRPSKRQQDPRAPHGSRRAARRRHGHGRIRSRRVHSPLFGGNSNWRGPIWLPVNYMLIQSIEKFHRFLGDGFSFVVPCLGNKCLTLKGVANLISERVVKIYRRDESGAQPALQARPPVCSDEHWRDLLLFYEYFHAETGQGLGASHQTGWTGLIANLVLRRYRQDAPGFWAGQKALAAQ
jgi:hypothetical protein